MKTEVIVVGTGGAALAALTKLAKTGLETVVLTRGNIRDSATDWAQGGLAAVLTNQDSIQTHVKDTLVAGAGLCDPNAVYRLAKQAPKAIDELIKLGADFCRNEAGGLDLHLEGGHSTRRIVHAHGDASGAEVERVLAENLLGSLNKTKIKLLENTRLVDISVDESAQVCGVKALDAKGEIFDISAKAVVLAAGGIGQLWPVTTNPPVCTGDGIAAAYRAGADIQDLEFMQFHPTVLFDPKATTRGVLISEAVRGEGAFLVDRQGKRIMAEAHELADLAPRDVVSATIMGSLAESGDENVYLDARKFGQEKWVKDFPTILALCLERGINPVNELIPVRPAAHYSCGGIRADMDGRTSLSGLYAVGENAATGVQGANRLASNSITEGLVCGSNVGELLADSPLPRPGKPVPAPRSPVISPTVLSTVKKEMDSNCFVLRNGTGLQQLADFLADLPEWNNRLTNEVLDVTNLVQVGKILVSNAAKREESRGCHRRSDYPNQEQAYNCRLVINRYLPTRQVELVSSTEN